ncbi:nuclear transport factor 2 family protein [Nocardia transvalensis]|uniref:nuclear transport factor 2 family protein n=1 Tax=Nocardia transvalensis TaxID=37333 RepID=UPI001895AFFC|nr:nuclear transport factor 2 family protein [Nocardia transvalensis]MBF6328046.1 nuclear transport factor 2 family protein [Nocardia transvalensis]
MTDATATTPPDAAAIEELFARLSTRDIEGLVALFTHNAAVAMPFQPPGFPAAMIGRDQIRDGLAVLEIYESAPFDMRVVGLQRLRFPGEWLVHIEGHLVVRATGRPYRNRYMANFRFENGKISQLTVYHNPLVQLAAYDLAHTQAVDDTAWERAAVERYYGLLFCQDHDSLLEMVAEDVEVYTPWQLPGLPEHVRGRDQLHDLVLSRIAALWSPGGLADLRIRPLNTPHTWIVDAQGDFTAQHSLRTYRAYLRGEIRFHQGKIAQITQFYNPLDQIIALGADIPGINAPGHGIDLAS